MERDTKIEIPHNTSIIKVEGAMTQNTDLGLVAVSPSILRVGAQANHYESVLHTTAAWSVSTATPWITAVAYPNQRVGIRVNSNTGTARTGTVTVKLATRDNSVLTKTITVHQKAPVAITHGPTILNIAAPKTGSTTTLDILAKPQQNWRIFGVNTWAQVKNSDSTKILGSGKGTLLGVKVVVKANNTGEARQTSVNFTVGSKVYAVKITQPA